MTKMAPAVKAMQLPNLEKNMAHCWRCSHCKWVPSPMSHEYAHACPSIEWGGFHPYSGGGKVITAYALQANEAGFSEAVKESIYACSMCGACDTSCKNNNGELVEPLGVLYALRAYAVDQGQAPAAHVGMVENLRRHGNAAGKPRAERSAWARGLALKDATREPVDVLLHIGCENAYDAMQWPELHAIVTLLRAAGVDFGIVYDAESATGETAYDLGFQEDARALAGAMANLIDQSGAKRIVTCSASSYHGLVNIWARLGLLCDIEVRHITEYVDALVEDGRLTLSGMLPRTITYHDPCKLGRLGEKFTPSDAKWTKVLQTVSFYDQPTHTLFGNGGVYEAPRKLLRRLEGVTLVEMERNRVAAYCCGAAGGAKEAVPEFAEAAATRRLAEASATGATLVATACGGCRGHLGAVAERQGGPAVKGIFTIIAEAAAAAASR